MTTRDGLYRYRIGDVVRIARFHNHTPVVEFLYRQGQLLNVHMEKTNESDFYGALINTLKKPQVSHKLFLLPEEVGGVGLVNKVLTGTGRRNSDTFNLYTILLSNHRHCKETPGIAS